MAYNRIQDVEIEPEAPVTQSLMQRLRDNPLALSAGRLHGLTLSNNVTDATNDIDTAPGFCISDDFGDAIVIPTTITKRLDANFVAGTGQGGRDTGGIANGTWHVFAIKNSATQDVDILFSLSATAPTMPAGFNLKRRIGSILREASAIVLFLQNGDRFYRLVRSQVDFTATTGGANHAVAVPLGVRVVAMLSMHIIVGGSSATVFGSPEATLPVPTGSNADISTSGSSVISSIYMEILTNTSAQFRIRSTSSFTIQTSVLGWIDSRGRDA